MELPIGDLLVTMSHIGKKQLDEAVEIQKVRGGTIPDILVNMGVITEEQILKALSVKFAIPTVDLSKTEITENAVKMVSLETVRRLKIMPISRSGTTLFLATSDPSVASDTKSLKLIIGSDVQVFLALETDIQKAIEQHYDTTGNANGNGNGNGEPKYDAKQFMTDLDINFDDLLEVVQEEERNDNIARLEKDSKQPPVVKIVNHCFLEAIKAGASDIHIEPFEGVLRIRFRIDGALYEILKVPLKYKDGVISRIKVMSRMDIAEKRVPQDGRIKLQVKVEGRMRNLDVRVSSTPTLFGEKIVMRLLDREGLMLDLSLLGFEPESLKRFEEAIFKPWGMVLVTGPTGSGKTNTLYSAIGQLNTIETNIMTVEDPIEFNIYGINQVQVHEGINLTFASVLRSFLRQDPNIILVGEIRDNETAAIAVKASLTGHLVLSTLHTNDAPSAVNRLADMEIDPYLVATSVILVVAQRLVRKVCNNCRREVETSPQALLNIGFTQEDVETLKIYQGKGCSVCNNTGYKGRIGLYEAMPVSPAVRDLIFSNAPASDIRKKAIEEGMISLRQSGLTKIKQGITTLEEVLRETF
jgi:type IV pilus assembly protein PilB